MEKFIGLDVSPFDAHFTLGPFLKHITEGLVATLPDGACVVEDEIEVDTDRVAERIITKMPIELDG